VVSGLGGHFFLLSGSAHLLKGKDLDVINDHFQLRSLTWPGTVVALRIPLSAQDFDYIRFLE
jgi:hypothetical protein